MPPQTLAGATETTPSRAQYFSWINNTNEGATAAQTAANLAFFQWLHDEYGMVLDIYAFDAGAIDGAGGYGKMDSERFRRQFPEGFAPLAKLAAGFGGRLGLWCGPDGFGETREDAAARIEMMASLARDMNFALFKMDGVCGKLREEKQPEFVEMMQQVRKYAPDLILLNHRLQLGIGMPYATTWLWEGVETYIDVHIANAECGVHNRVCTLTRGNTPGLARLTEDHGVCLSSCLDFWEDDLVVQAFGRCLILSPELYGSPWLLRDDEFPRLARLFNLHRRWRDILVHGIELPAETFGAHAVSRGDESTRLIVLRNPGWETKTVRVPLDQSIGLAGGGRVRVVRLHPYERWLGESAAGESVSVELPAGRALLMVASREEIDGPWIEGCDAEVVRDVEGRPVEMKLLGLPGTTANVRLHAGQRRLPKFEREVTFEGTAPTRPWHRKIGDLASVAVPKDAEALYEATCFAADNNALEVRELERSGPTKIPQVAAARDAFFNQSLFRKRNLWDRYMFDDDAETGLGVCRRWTWRNVRIGNGGLRIDFGRPTLLDHLAIEVGEEYFLQPLKWHETVWGSVSDDLVTWVKVPFFIDTTISGKIPDHKPWRYLRLQGCPDLVREVRGFYRGAPADRSGWRGSNLFASYGGWRGAKATHAWELPFELPDAPNGSYLAIAIHGKHGEEKASAALRVDGKDYRGAPRRSPSFVANVWECPVKPCVGHSTWYIPVTPDLVGRKLEAVAMVMEGGDPNVRVEAWITAYPPPYVAKGLVLE